MKRRFAVWLLMLTWLAAPAMAATPGEVAVGSVLREASMAGLNGQAKKLSAFRGKPLLINVWASWCGPCREEMASLNRLSRRYGGKQFAMIGISTDDYPEAAKAFLQKSQTPFAHFIDQQLLLEDMLGADRLPLTLLIDSQGRVLGKFYGAKEWDSPAAIETIGKAFQVKL